VRRSALLIAAAAVAATAALAAAAPAAARERGAALDALVAAQTTYGGWVFAAPPGERPRPFTELLRVAERVAAPVGFATWDLLVLRSPGTPAAALELLAGDAAERAAVYAAAAERAGDLLVATQLEAGGWFSEMPIVDGAPTWWFRRLAWRITLDDDVTTGATRVLLALWDRTRNGRYRTAARHALDLLHAAQLPSGAFSIVWRPAWLRRVHASAEDAPSLNDGATPLAIETLVAAARIFRDPRHLDAARRAGDWLVSVQLGDPAPGWAQQYNDDGRPAPARRFEPAALATWETRHAVEALMALAEAVREPRYCGAAARALRWLARARLRDGCWARYLDLADGSPVYVAESGRRVADVALARPGYSWTGEFGIPALLDRLGLDENARRRHAPHPVPAPLPGDPGTCPGEAPHAPDLEGARLLVAMAARARPVEAAGAGFCASAFDHAGDAAR
jgi:hypothetical protein